MAGSFQKGCGKEPLVPDVGDGGDGEELSFFCLRSPADVISGFEQPC